MGETAHRLSHGRLSIDFPEDVAKLSALQRCGKTLLHALVFPGAGYLAPPACAVYECPCSSEERAGPHTL
jgi:hypothetical protein